MRKAVSTRMSMVSQSILDKCAEASDYELRSYSFFVSFPSTGLGEKVGKSGRKRVG